MEKGVRFRDVPEVLCSTNFYYPNLFDSRRSLETLYSSAQMLVFIFCNVFLTKTGIDDMYTYTLISVE